MRAFEEIGGWGIVHALGSHLAQARRWPASPHTQLLQLSYLTGGLGSNEGRYSGFNRVIIAAVIGSEISYAPST